MSQKKVQKERIKPNILQIDRLRVSALDELNLLFYRTKIPENEQVFGNSKRNKNVVFEPHFRGFSEKVI